MASGEVLERESHPFPTLMAEEYLGMSWVPLAEQAALPEQMSAYEIELLLGNTNNEIKAAILGVIGENPISERAIFDELLERGAFELETMERDNFLRKVRGLTPGLVRVDEDMLLHLTPYGEVARAFAGQLMAIGLHRNISLQDLSAERRFQVPDADDQDNRGYGQTKRVLFIATILRSGSKGISTTELKQGVNKKHGITEAMFKPLCDSLIDRKLADVEVHPPTKGGRRWKISPERVESFEEFLDVIRSFIVRDKQTMEEGVWLLDDVLHDPRLPFLIKRAVGKSNEGRFPVLYPIHDIVSPVLDAASGPLTVSEIYERVQDKFDGTKGELARHLRDIMKHIPQARFQKAEATKIGVSNLYESKIKAVKY